MPSGLAKYIKVPETRAWYQPHLPKIKTFTGLCSFRHREEPILCFLNFYRLPRILGSWPTGTSILPPFFTILDVTGISDRNSIHKRYQYPDLSTAACVFPCRITSFLQDHRLNELESCLSYNFIHSPYNELEGWLCVRGPKRMVKNKTEYCICGLH